MFDLVANESETFPQAVERLFDLSFLVNKGRIKVDPDGRGDLVVSK